MNIVHVDEHKIHKEVLDGAENTWSYHTYISLLFEASVQQKFQKERNNNGDKEKARTGGNTG